MCFLRRMLRIARTDKVSNEEGLQKFKEPIHQEISWNLLLTDKSDLWDTSWERVSWKRSRWPGWSKAKELEVDKGKRLRIGYHSLVGNNGMSTTYWQFVMNAMSIADQRQSLIRHLHWIGSIDDVLVLSTTSATIHRVVYHTYSDASVKLYLSQPAACTTTTKVGWLVAWLVFNGTFSTKAISCHDYDEEKRTEQCTQRHIWSGT